MERFIQSFGIQKLLKTKFTPYTFLKLYFLRLKAKWSNSSRAGKGHLLGHDECYV